MIGSESELSMELAAKPIAGIYQHNGNSVSMCGCGAGGAINEIHSPTQSNMTFLFSFVAKKNKMLSSHFKRNTNAAKKRKVVEKCIFSERIRMLKTCCQISFMKIAHF